MGAQPRHVLEQVESLARGAARRAEALAPLSNGQLRAAVRRCGAEITEVEACALAFEATRRVLGVELHDSQLVAGAAMACGLTVQMRTGEGKTFAAIAPGLFYGLRAGSVHVVTANAYLAARDARWSGRVLEMLGLTVGVTLPGRSRPEIRHAYTADVTFGAATDFAFDYLRDHLFLPGDERVQRQRRVALVDEADAVLLDNARTPMVLSGAGSDAAAALRRVEEVVRRLRLDIDVALDHEHRRIELTDAGIDRCQQLLGIANMYDPTTGNWPYLIHNALRARAWLARDRDYIVIGGRVEDVDEVTGRIVEGRRWSEGIQQAVEAKEGVDPSVDREPIARITQAGYFGGYEKLVGMSGTLDGVEDELAAVYGLQTVAIATHRPVIRVDSLDVVFATRQEKFDAVADDVAGRCARGQPVLVGTRSIRDTWEFSGGLTKRGVPHETLTAQDHHREAAIVAAAGRPGAVTVATQMAGRGVDIVLGDGVGAAGGLMVWGLEHHSARRLDMQLRGRSGRQGDPGESRFAVCPDDEYAQLGHDRMERLERELRDDVRRYDTAIDALHAHLYRWRQEAATSSRLPGLLEQAIQHTAHGRRARNRLRARLDARQSELGAELFGDAAQLILRMLLVVLWPQTLEELETSKPLSRIGVAFGTGGTRGWQQAAVAAYGRFAATTDHQWIDQLLHFQVGPPSPQPQADTELVLPPENPDLVLDAPEEELDLIDWKGWSYNRFVREHWGIRLPDPPVVLVVDAIGETPTLHGLQLHLDLDNPRATHITPAP